MFNISTKQSFNVKCKQMVPTRQVNCNCSRFVLDAGDIGVVGAVVAVVNECSDCVVVIFLWTE